MSLLVQNLFYTANGKTIFSNAELCVGKGELAVIHAVSGAGKTTLFQMLAGELSADAGSIQLGVHQLPARSQTALTNYRREVGLVFQDIRLLSDKSIEENIAFPLELYGGMSKKRRAERVRATITRFGLEEVSAKRPETLSGGQRQTAAIARAAVAEPLILIADEPTAMLDTVAANAVIAQMLREHLRGMTILILTNRSELLLDSPAKHYYLAEGSFHPESLADSVDYR